MSVGGTVINVYDEESRRRITVRDEPPYSDVTSIYVRLTKDVIKPGDIVWWQGEWALWTPKTGEFEDRKIQRIGYSFCAEVVPNL
jgi:hypothetical protein